MLQLAHAKSNEMGQTTGGKAGDQTGHEVEITAWQEYDWTDVFRPYHDADKYAECARTICKNDAVGYNQNDRYSLTLLARSVGWDFSKVKTACNTDCSAMVAAICNACGIPVSIYMYTGNETGELTKTGAYAHLPYTGASALRNGDIILTTKRGHTAVVLRDSEPQPAPFTPWVGEAYGTALIPVWQDSAKSALLPQWSYLGTGNLFDVIGEADSETWQIRIAAQFVGYISKVYCLRKTPQKTVKVTTDLHLRANAGSGYKSLAVIPKNTKISYCDQKKASDGKPWDYVIYNGIYGFCSDRYVK